MNSKSKFFRVAVEGATTDGRNIERAWIEQMAKNFDPKKYGARVWLEHYRGIAPDGLFKAYGDVLAVKAEEVEIDGKKKMALFAQIEPQPDLVAMNKAKQKIYTSAEIHPKFADSGEAYLTGLAVTDSPASLGTDVLTFAQQHPTVNPLAGRKSHPDTLFTEAIEAALEFETAVVDDGTAAKFSATIKGVIEKLTGKGKTDDARFAEVLGAFEQMGSVFSDQANQFAAQQGVIVELGKKLDTLSTKHADLVKKLEGTPANHSQRPAATGGSGKDQTDC